MEPVKQITGQASHRSIRERFRGNPNKLPVSANGGTVRYLGRQYEDGKLTHYRGWQEDLRPYVDRTKAISEGSSFSKKGFGYMASIPRIVIHDWLMRQGKDWSDFATDKDLKAKFLKWFNEHYSKMTADAHRERPLSVNRSQSGRLVSRPKLGAQILNDYRKEMAT
jgi:hypothetical protein